MYVYNAIKYPQTDDTPNLIRELQQLALKHDKFYKTLEDEAVIHNKYESQPIELRAKNAEKYSKEIKKRFKDSPDPFPLLDGKEVYNIRKWWKENESFEYDNRIKQGMEKFGFINRIAFEGMIDPIEDPEGHSERKANHSRLLDSTLKAEIQELINSFSEIIHQDDWENFITYAVDECKTPAPFIMAALGTLGYRSPDEQDHYVACEILKLEGYYQGEENLLRPILDNEGNHKSGLFEAQIRSPFFRRYYKNKTNFCDESCMPNHWPNQNQDFL